MKLITKITLSYLLFTTIIVGIGAVISYQILRFEVDEKTNFYLWDEKKVIQRISALDNLSHYNHAFGDQLEVFPLADLQTFREEMKDTVIVAPIRNRKINYRQLRFAHTLNGQPHQVVLRKPLVESRDLVEGVQTGMLLAGAGMIFVLVIINYLIAKRIWAPFYSTLGQIDTYDLAKRQALQFEKPSTREFDLLNAAISRMTRKIQQDYSSLKEFTENASHELQTPIAVINSQVELLQQSTNLDPKALDALREIESASRRMGRLNRALLLLTRIENDQYSDAVDIDMRSLWEKQISEMQELAALRGQQLVIHGDGNPIFRLHRELASILVKNLLGNAIKYAPDNSQIAVEFSDNAFEISNPGMPLQLDPAKLFDRFSKGEQSASSLGLGLSIARKICDVHSLSISYIFENQLHRFKVSS